MEFFVFVLLLIPRRPPSFLGFSFFRSPFSLFFSLIGWCLLSVARSRGVGPGKGGKGAGADTQWVYIWIVLLFWLRALTQMLK